MVPQQPGDQTSSEQPQHEVVLELVIRGGGHEDQDGCHDPAAGACTAAPLAVPSPLFGIFVGVVLGVIGRLPGAGGSLSGVSAMTSLPSGVERTVSKRRVVVLRRWSGALPVSRSRFISREVVAHQRP